MTLMDYGYKEETIKVRTMPIAEMKLGIAKELWKKNYDHVKIKAICLTDGSVDEYNTTQDFLIAGDNDAWLVDLLSVKEVFVYEESEKCSKANIIIVFRDSVDIGDDFAETECDKDE